MCFSEDTLRETQTRVHSTMMYIAPLKLGQDEQLQPSLVKLCAGYENYLIKVMCRLWQRPHHDHLGKNNCKVLVRKNMWVSEMLNEEKEVHLQIHKLRTNEKGFSQSWGLRTPADQAQFRNFMERISKQYFS